jgi:hypothetical protein
MIEVGKQAPDFELASHLAGTKFTLNRFQGAKKCHVGVLSAGLDADLNEGDSWPRGSERRVQGL